MIRKTLDTDIPTVMGPDGEEDFHNPIRYGSAARNEYIW